MSETHNQFETLAVQLGGHEPPFSSQERISIQAAQGFIDARMVVDLYQTNGLPVIMALDRASRYDLRPDWGGLEIEACLQLGKSREDAKKWVSAMRKEYELTK